MYTFADEDVKKQPSYEKLLLALGATFYDRIDAKERIDGYIRHHQPETISVFGNYDGYQVDIDWKGPKADD